MPLLARNGICHDRLNMAMLLEAAVSRSEHDPDLEAAAAAINLEAAAAAANLEAAAAASLAAAGQLAECHFFIPPGQSAVRHLTRGAMRLLIDGSNLSLRFAASPNPTLYSPDGTALPPVCSS